MSRSTLLRNTLAATALVCLPWLAFAQVAPAPAGTAATPAKASTVLQSAGRSREAVSREVREAMRESSWRCLTNSRGYCSTRGAAPRA